jgi:hypothetical protein
MEKYKKWIPLIFYCANILGWLNIALAAREWGLLWLIIFPITVVLLTVIKISKS